MKAFKVLEMTLEQSLAHLHFLHDTVNPVCLCIKGYSHPLSLYPASLPDGKSHSYAQAVSYILWVTNNQYQLCKFSHPKTNLITKIYVWGL